MKTYRGWELIKAIENGEIKDQTKIKTDCGDIFIYDKEDATFYWEKRLGGNRVPIHTLLIHTFELIEEQQDIDIQAIEEINAEDLIIYRMLDTETKEENDILNVTLAKKINQILQWAKQSDRKIREEK